MHAWGLRLRRACGALALPRTPVWPSGCRDTVGALIDIFRSSLLRDTQPAYAPVQRFHGGLAIALAWLGVRMVRYSFPVWLFHSLLHVGLSRRYPRLQSCRRTAGTNGFSPV